MTEPALFDVDQPDPAPETTPAQRLRTRQLARIRAGWHPLPGPIRLHPNADRDAEPNTGRRDPYRCGSCIHRRTVGGHAHTFPKCDIDSWARATNGPATDVKAWWPACIDYEPFEETAP